MKRIVYACMFLALCLAGCKDTDGLEADLNDLKDRVTAIEAQVAELNNNIKAIRELSKEGMTITTIEHDAAKGSYTIGLSDGTTVKLTEKTDGTGVIPLIGIHPDGYWQVSYDGGTKYEPILIGGQPVQAKGENGVTPKFRVSTTGYWQVCTDGTTYIDVLDENNQPVKAVLDPDAPGNDFFTSVTAGNNSLELVLTDGTVINVPVVKNFFCYFDQRYTGVQTIGAGQSTTFDVHIKGAESLIITTPTGWKAVLGNANASDVATLTVTAPAAATTTRAVADNTKDVSILATAGLFGQLTKIQVQTGAEVTPPGILAPVITASTTFETVGKFSSTKNPLVGKETDCWFLRDVADATAITALTIDATELAFKAIVAGSKGSWNNSAFGYHSTSTFDRTAKYKLTFQVKSDVKGSVGITARSGLDAVGFRMVKSDGSSMERNITTPTTTTEWEEVVQYFNLGFAAEAMTSTASIYINGTEDGKQKGERPTTDEDVKQLNLYFYNNQPNSTLYLKNVKLEKL